MQDTYNMGIVIAIIAGDLIEIDNAFIDGRLSGKRGRVAEDKHTVLVAVVSHDSRAGFIAMQQNACCDQGSGSKICAKPPVTSPVSA